MKSRHDKDLIYFDLKIITTMANIHRLQINLIWSWIMKLFILRRFFYLFTNILKTGI